MEERQVAGQSGGNGAIKSDTDTTQEGAERKVVCLCVCAQKTRNLSLSAASERHRERKLDGLESTQKHTSA